MKYYDKDNLSKVHIVYEDNHICVVVKPAGMVVPIQTDSQNSLQAHVLRYFKKKLQKDTIFLQPVHRLDKPVAGFVLFARSSKALKRLNLAQQNKEIKKFYLACVEGQIYPHAKKLEHKLIHGDFKAFVDSKNGKFAKLKYRLLKQNREYSWVLVQLFTGRYHQIRLQLSEHGYPINGDIKYGGSAKHEESIDLYHIKLVFSHPVKKSIMSFALRN